MYCCALLCVHLVLKSSYWRRESLLLCFVCLPGFSWLLYGSSSRCHSFFCSLWLWYYLIILTIFSRGGSGVDWLNVFINVFGSFIHKSFVTNMSQAQKYLYYLVWLVTQNTMSNFDGRWLYAADFIYVLSRLKCLRCCLVQFWFHYKAIIIEDPGMHFVFHILIWDDWCQLV